MSNELIEAIQNNEIEKAKELIIKSSILEINEAGHITLYWAVRKGFEDLVELLLQKTDPENFEDRTGNTMLHVAAYYGHPKIIELLLNHPNVPDLLNYIDTHNHDLQTPLHEAVAGGHEETIKLLLEKGANVNAQNNEGDTPLHKAAAGGEREEPIKLLLEKGADINAQNKAGNTSLHIAVAGRHEETVKLLLEKGANVNAQNNEGDTPLHKAVSESFTSVIEILLEYRAKINLENRIWKVTALDIAKYRKNPQILSLFENHQLKLNQQLLNEVQAGNEQEVDNLIAQGANVNYQDNGGGHTAHFYAVKAKNKAVIEKLLAAGADVNLGNNNNITAQKKAKLIKAFGIAALVGFAIVAAGGLVIGIGALAGWGVMAGLLSFAPWLAIAIPAAIVGITVVGALAYGIKRLIANKQEQLDKLDKLSHSSKERLLDESPDKQDEVKQALGTASSFGNPLASPSSNVPSPSVGASSNQPKG